MGLDERRELIRGIEAARGSRVIAYVTSDRPGLQAMMAGDAISLMHEHVLSLGDQTEKIDLFLYSRGGDSDVPWSMVTMLREYCKKGSFSVLIPYRAHSAATVVGLGADEIVMSKKAELGPIDATIPSGPYNPVDDSSKQRLPVSVEDVMGFFSLLEKVVGEPSENKLDVFIALMQNVHPLALGNVNRLLEHTKLVASRLLETRANPFTKELNGEIVQKMSGEISSHGHAIGRAEAKNYVGLSHAQNSEDVGIDEEMWSLYREYKELFDLDMPFAPEDHLIVEDLAEHTWNELPVACIESENRLSVARKSVRVVRMPAMPPNLNMNLKLGNINVPINTSGSGGRQLDDEALRALVANVVQQAIDSAAERAAKKAIEELVASLPQAGFQRADFNFRWGTEGTHE